MSNYAVESNLFKVYITLWCRDVQAVGGIKRTKKDILKNTTIINQSKGKNRDGSKTVNDHKLDVLIRSYF